MEVSPLSRCTKWKARGHESQDPSTTITVPMALLDANLQCIAIDVGSYGRNSDGGIFQL